MTAPLDWQVFEHLPTLNRQQQFTGWGAQGNGYTLLSWLHEHRIDAVRDGNDILLRTEKREDARFEVGDWLVDDDSPGTTPEAWPIPAAVHDAKYRRAS
jgi:hypothetical protein